MSNAQIPDAATRCGGLAAKISSTNRVFASPGRQQVGASIKLSGSEPLARLRARGQLTELRQFDLRFTTNKAAAFLNRVMGLNLVPDHVTVLEPRTETRAACQSPLSITS